MSICLAGYPFKFVKLGLTNEKRKGSSSSYMLLMVFSAEERCSGVPEKLWLSDPDHDTAVRQQCCEEMKNTYFYAIYKNRNKPEFIKTKIKSKFCSRFLETDVILD